MTGQQTSAEEQAVLCGDEESLLVPRLVARIAELEHALYNNELQLKNGGKVEDGAGILAKFSSLLKQAHKGLDATVAFLVGEVEGQQAQQAAAGAGAGQQPGNQAALTKEATAKALLITLRKLQSLKQDKEQLEQRAADITRHLEEAKAALRTAEDQAAAVANERDSLAAEAQALSSAQRQDQEALAAVTLEMERLQHLQMAASSSQGEALAAAVAAAEQAAAAQREQHERALAAAAAAHEQAAAAQREQHAEALAAAQQAAAAQHAEHQQALAAAVAAHEEAVAAQQAEHADALAAVQQVAAEQRAQQAEALAATVAAHEAASAALRAEVAQRAQQVAELAQHLEEALGQGRELQSQLEASQAECQRLRQQMAGMSEAAEALNVEAEGLRAARAAVAQELNETKVKLERARSDCEEFQRRFLQERLERRKVHEQLQVLRGNIRVICRVRPLASPADQQCVTFPFPGAIALHPSDKRVQEFEFDSVFESSSSQEAVFDEVAPLIRSCADGYNVCIFAYGQTGSGKTHTMQGPESNPGLSVRALQALFNITARDSQSGSGVQRTVSVSMLEIYNENVRDLLATGAEALKPMEVSGLGAGQLQAGMERVPGLTWRSVHSVEDVLSVLAQGTKSRATAATALNAHSSRSHALLSVRLSDPSGHHPPTLLHLVDLAGSERIARSEVSGQQLKEAQAINKSLSALGDVIAALQAKSGHVPYRNSKLTQVLQDSLCGSSKVLLVCCVSPETASAQESLSSLGFASRASQVELGPVKKVTEVSRKTGEQGGAAAGKGSPMTPSMTKSRLGGTPLSASMKKSVLREANTPS